MSVRLRSSESAAIAAAAHLLCHPLIPWRHSFAPRALPHCSPALLPHCSPACSSLLSLTAHCLASPLANASAPTAPCGADAIPRSAYWNAFLYLATVYSREDIEFVYQGSMTLPQAAANAQHEVRVTLLLGCLRICLANVALQRFLISILTRGQGFEGVAELRLDVLPCLHAEMHESL